MRNEKGYIRLKHGAHHDKYEHRVVLAALCSEFCVYPLAADGLPTGMTVEHLDHRRSHNCASNLILLDKRIHDAISWCNWRRDS